MLKKSGLIIIIFLCISFLLTYVFFNDLKPDEFLFVGDQFFRFTLYEAFSNAFTVRKLENFGVHNGWQFTTQFFDALYYIIAYSFGLSIYTTEILLFFIVLSVSFCISFFGLKRILLLFEKPINTPNLFLITLWYCVNPYTVILWHGGAFNLGSSLTYALAPWLLYYLDLSLFSKSNLRTKVIASLLLFIASFTFWLFAVLIFVFALYVLINLIFKKPNLNNFIKNVAILALLYLPLISFILYGVINEYFNNVGDNNASFVPTFGNQLGGMWYQLLMYFSWGIYTYWAPRSIYPYGQFYTSWTYLISTLSIYGLILLGIVKKYIPSGRKVYWPALLSESKKETYYILCFLIIFLISLFFAKAAQPPFGGIFLYLYDNLPLFSVFRSADHRFGFAIVLCLTLLLLVTSKYLSKKLFPVILLLIIIFQNYIFLNGTAVKGLNTVKDPFYDRVISLPYDYKLAANVLKADTGGFGFVLPVPAIEYGHYLLKYNNESVDHFIGQDPLTKLLPYPPSFISASSGMYTKTNQQLLQSIKEKNWDSLKQFSVKYLVLRNDIECVDCKLIESADVSSTFRKILNTDHLSVYKNMEPTPLIEGTAITYQLKSPTKFRVYIPNMKDSASINLLLSFNKSFRVYVLPYNSWDCGTNRLIPVGNSLECQTQLSTLELSDIKYLSLKPIDSNFHSEIYDYANSWNISSEYIIDNYSSDYYKRNSDGTIDIVLDIYYFPQALFTLFFLISLTTLVIMTVYLFKNKLLYVLLTLKPTNKISNKKIKVFRFIALTFSLILSIVVLEVVFTMNEKRELNLTKSLCSHFSMDKFATSRGYSLTNAHYLPNEQVVHCGIEFDYVYSINDLGFRQTSNSSQTNQDILAIGDSFTFGFGVKDNEAFPALLQAHNAGMWGNPFDVQIESFKRNIELTKPKTIIWSIYPSHLITMMPKEWSDRCPGDSVYFIGDTTRAKIGRTLTKIFVEPVMKNTAIGRYVFKHFGLKKFEISNDSLMILKDCYQTKEILLYDSNLENNKYTYDLGNNKSLYTDREAVYKQLEGYIKESKVISDTYGAKVYFVIIPSRMHLNLSENTYSVNYEGSTIDPNLPAKTLEQMITNAGYSHSSIIDLSPYFLSLYDWKPYYFEVDAHWNNKGHKFVSEVIKTRMLNDEYEQK